MGRVGQVGLVGSLVYKIVPEDLWRVIGPGAAFAGSDVDLRDGFIHLSTAAQVQETAARHFAGLDNLLLVAVNTDRVSVRWEPSRGGELFPHLYGALPYDAVDWVRPLPLGPDGLHVFGNLD